MTQMVPIGTLQVENLIQRRAPITNRLFSFEHCFGAVPKQGPAPWLACTGTDLINKFSVRIPVQTNVCFCKKMEIMIE